jgi:cellobiose phosphorylase
MRKRGPSGLPLIGRADWNDCLNLNCFSTEPNEPFQTAGTVQGSRAESVMIAGLFLRAAGDLAALCQHLGRSERAQALRGVRAEMLAAIEATAWDGDWYTRAYDAAGRVVGGRACAEGRIFLESQAWCVLGGAGADNGRARRALESVEEHLATPDGILLLQPAYTAYSEALGEVSSYPPGVKENAGIFCHANTWIHLAWCQLGDGDRALASYLSICPSAKQAQIERYRAEPYVHAQMIAGRDAPCAGEAKNSWLTGTAAWSHVVASQGILGIQPEYRGLRLDPCIPRAWGGFTATRRFRGDTYRIRVSNPQGVSKGVARLCLDGRDLDPAEPIPPPGDGGDHLVEVVLGAGADRPSTAKR